MKKIDLTSRKIQAKLYIDGVIAHTDGDREGEVSHYKVIDISRNEILVVYGVVDWSNFAGSVFRYTPHILHKYEYGDSWALTKKELEK